MMKINKCYAMVWCGLMLTACLHTDPLENALRYAGENRTELEKVLRHYETRPEDSLKLQAARWLIIHMPGHLSYHGKTIERYYQEIEPILTGPRTPWEKRPLIEEIARKYPPRSMEAEEDIKIITVGYLIRNIEEAFRVWQDEPWGRHVSFEDFCEYILPYKCTEYQPLDNWREELGPLAGDVLPDLAYCELYRHSAYRACESVQERLKEIMKPAYSHAPLYPLLSACALKHLPFGTCYDYGVVTLAAMRSKGIPVAIDFTPQWPMQGSGHSWNVLLDDTGQTKKFGGVSDTPLREAHKPLEKMGKVYRKTYAVNPEIRRLFVSEKYIPPLFCNLFIRDVTAEYMAVVTLPIRLSGKIPDTRYAYLAVFDNHTWQPIDFARISRRQAIFRHIGRNIVYLPVYYTADGPVPAGYPCRVGPASGQLRELIPDTTARQTLVLQRTHPVMMYLYSLRTRLKGGKIQAAHHSDFRDAQTIHEFTTYNPCDTLQICDSVSYRYWRYLSAPGGRNNMAELLFYADTLDYRPLQGEIIGSEGSYQENPRWDKRAVFDGDPATVYEARHRSGDWAGLDFGRPVSPAAFAYLFRADINTVRSGDRYELFYQDREGWVSLGIREATGWSVRFEGAPRNALFLLRHTEGKGESRPFTWEGGEAVWW